MQDIRIVYLYPNYKKQSKTLKLQTSRSRILSMNYNKIKNAMLNYRRSIFDLDELSTFKC